MLLHCVCVFLCAFDKWSAQQHWVGTEVGAAENAAVASRCTGEGLIFAQQLLTPPRNHHHHRLKERGQQPPHKWLRYRHINPGGRHGNLSVSPNPHSSSLKIPRRKTIAKMHLGNMWHCRGQAVKSRLNVHAASCPSRLQRARHTAGRTSVHDAPWCWRAYRTACGGIKLAARLLLVGVSV